MITNLQEVADIYLLMHVPMIQLFSGSWAQAGDCDLEGEGFASQGMVKIESHCFFILFNDLSAEHFPFIIPQVQECAHIEGDLFSKFIFLGHFQ